jgi:hypothetical protein
VTKSCLCNELRTNLTDSERSSQGRGDGNYSITRIHRGLVFSVTGYDDRVIATDKETGRVVWDKNLRPGARNAGSHPHLPSGFRAIQTIAYDASGIPLHRDNRTVIKERIFLDKADANLLYDEITTYDHALTRPWTVLRFYRRVVTDKPIWWREDVCAEANNHVGIGNENYFLSADGLLMPAKKDQPPPDLRYFKQTASPFLDLSWRKKGLPSSLVQLRSAVWTGVTRDTRPRAEVAALMDTEMTAAGVATPTAIIELENLSRMMVSVCLALCYCTLFPIVKNRRGIAALFGIGR